MAELGQERLFFEAADRSFRNPVDWGTLIALVNEDYTDILAKTKRNPDSLGKWFFNRIDNARVAVGGKPIFQGINDDTLAKLAELLQDELQIVVSDWNAAVPETLEGKTLVIEFARGAPQGSQMPPPFGFGYGYSLSKLSREILEKAAILYIWVTPEQSRQKNLERAKPDADGSILFHGVPMHVMLNDYGCDDMEYQLSLSDVPGTVKVDLDGESFHIPAGRFDNRGDLTTFLREDPDAWREENLTVLRNGIAGALDTAFAVYSK